MSALAGSGRVAATLRGQGAGGCAFRAHGGAAGGGAWRTALGRGARAGLDGLLGKAGTGADTLLRAVEADAESL